MVSDIFFAGYSVPNQRCFGRSLAGAGAAALFCGLTAVHAGQLREAQVPPVPGLTMPVTIDGNLADWHTPVLARFAPLPMSENALGHVGQAEAEVFPAERTETAISLAYDAEALYVGLDWQDPTPAVNTTPGDRPEAWAGGGDGAELHLLCGGTSLHVVTWPLKSGRATALWWRKGGDAWQKPVKGLQAETTVRKAKDGWSQEIRIPWSLLTADSALPTSGRLELMADLAWSGLTDKALRGLALPRQRDACHVTCSVLAANPAFNLNAYLPNAGTWGDVVFGDKPASAILVTAPLYASATEMTAVPMPATAKCDGHLDKWPTDAFLPFALAPEFLGTRYSGRVAVAYDAEALWFVAEIAAPAPPQNNKPENTQQGFGGGDALQIRISNGAGFTANLCAWFDSATGKPALTADGAERPAPFLLTQGAEQVILPSADGRHYVQELRLPWKTLLTGKAQPPKSGDRWKLTFQPWWKGVSPAFTLYTRLTLLPQPPLAYSYELPRAGQVSLGLVDAQDRLLRWLLQDEFRPTGKNQDRWDGLDQWGKPLAAGRYALKGIVRDALKTDYRFTFANPGNPPWPTTDGRGDWLSDESSPQAAVTDGRWIFLAAPGSEKGFAVIAVDETGQRRWGVNEEVYPRCVALALAGDRLYGVYCGPEFTSNSRRYDGKNADERVLLVCYDKKTGAAAGFSRLRPRTVILRRPYTEPVTPLWELRAQGRFAPAVYGGQPRYFSNDLGEAASVQGIAAAGGNLYVSVLPENRVLVLDAESAESRGDFPLPAPVGLHAADDKSLLAVSQGQVVRIDLVTRAVTPVVTNGLEAPHSVTTDRAGRIYVSDWGKSFQVKVFESDGKSVRAIGQPGGRPWLGPWAADGMLVPRGIAVTDAGRLWVAEDDSSPKRISVWDAATGTFVRDYIGPAPYGGGAPFAVDPQEPTVMYTLGTRFRVDWGKGTWTPEAIVIRRMSRDQPFAANGHGCMCNGTTVVRENGREYMIHRGGPLVTVSRRDGDVFVPVAALGGISRLVTDDGSGQTLWDSDIGYHTFRNYYPEFFRGHAGDNFTWVDRNNDGLVQAAEMTWLKTLSRGEKFTPDRQPEWHTPWGAGVAPDGSVFFSAFCRDAVAIYRIDREGWTDAGAPVYDIQNARLLRQFDDPECISGLYVTRANRLILTFEVPNRVARGKSMPLRDSVMACDRDGRELWSVAAPTQMLDGSVAASNAIGEFDLPGIGPVVCFWNWWWNCRPYLLTDDGLYAGTLLDPTRIGPAALWGESYNYFFQTPDGAPYIVNGANDAHHILRVNGFEGARRFTGALTLAPADLAKAGALQRLPEVKPPPPPVPAIAWLAAPPQIDGELKEWDMRRSVRLDGGRGRSAEIALGRDAGNLYLAYQVQDPTPLVNRGSNWQTLFVSGDCVDIMLATDPKADPQRREAANGDLRLLFSVVEDQPVAVLYRPVNPATKTPPVQLMAARFAEIAKLADAKVAFRRGTNGYTIEATVPLATLGINPGFTGQLRGDVGVIFSDPTGSGRELRLYYFNHRTEMVSDLTTEATLQPAEWGGISFPLGLNLLRNGSFEDGFVSSNRDGWQIELQLEGGAVRLDDVAPHSGRQSLLIEQTKPVTFPDAAWKLPDWGTFVKSANDGRGGGHVSLCQQVPVTPGKKYRYRVFFRSEGFRPEKREPGPGRGYVALTPYLFWQGLERGDPATTIPVRNIQENSNEWQAQLNAFSHGVAADSFTAPPGATGVIVSFKFTAALADTLPKVWVDDVELVESDLP